MCKAAMIGIFDSGAGGLTVLWEIRRRAPAADLIYLADRENAPYGTKSEEEITRLVKRDIQRLQSEGADRILIACCTASTVYRRLTDSERAVSIPIIAPAARAAAKETGNGKIAVIATKRTVASGAFSNAMPSNGKREVFEYEAQELVYLVERGERDGSCCEKTRRYLKKLLAPIENSGADTLVLGCTHFPHLYREIRKILPNMKIISPSREGALELLKQGTPTGGGKTIYL